MQAPMRVARQCLFRSRPAVTRSCQIQTQRRIGTLEEASRSGASGNNQRYQAMSASPLEPDAIVRPGPSRAAIEAYMDNRARIVPVSPSYFTGRPQFNDHLLELEALLRKHETLPVVPTGAASRTAWKKLGEYRVEYGEPVKSATYKKLVDVLARLNQIQPSLMPDEVGAAMAKFERHVQPHLNTPRPVHVDEYGRARAVGRRKSSHAVVHLVEGEGEVLVNGKSLTQVFGRVHDRESAVWALKATGRMDKYNVWAIVRGGGTTGQAEAVTLAVAKALLVHEPALKPALRRAGCVTRDPRRVERKKPGKLKARKMPAWVKR